MLLFDELHIAPSTNLYSIPPTMVKTSVWSDIENQPGYCPNSKYMYQITYMSIMFTWDTITTLTLSSRPRQRPARVRAKREARESRLMLLRVWESVREWTFTFPSELPLWELESKWISKFLESDCRGQKPLDYGVPYIIRKLLEHRCLKWACMTHLGD
jgi:hypothetical protein